MANALAKVSKFSESSSIEQLTGYRYIMFITHLTQYNQCVKITHVVKIKKGVVEDDNDDDGRDD